MGVGVRLYMYVVVVQKFTFAISSPDEFLSICVQLELKLVSFQPNVRLLITGSIAHSASRR